jgi:hypothetical protein
MYGIVNKSIEDLVITNLEREWDIIHKKKWRNMISFLSNEVYDDDVTYKIATAVGDTNMTLSECL